MFRHISPNMVSLMLVLAGFDVVAGILAETGLSFLGLGIRPPIPSWGNMLTNSLELRLPGPLSWSSSPAWPSGSWCSASTCSPTACATPSTPG